MTLVLWECDGMLLYREVVTVSIHVLTVTILYPIPHSTLLHISPLLTLSHTMPHSSHSTLNSPHSISHSITHYPSLSLTLTHSFYSAPYSASLALSWSHPQLTPHSPHCTLHSPHCTP